MLKYILLVLLWIIAFLDSSNGVDCREEYDVTAGNDYVMFPEAKWYCTAEKYCVFVQVDGAYRKGTRDQYIEGTFRYCADQIEEFCYNNSYGISNFEKIVIRTNGAELDLVDGKIKAACCTDNYCNTEYYPDFERGVGYQNCIEGRVIKYGNGEPGRQKYEPILAECSGQEYCMHVKADLQVPVYDDQTHENEYAKGDFWVCVRTQLEIDFCEEHELNKFHHFHKLMDKWPSFSPVEPQKETIQARCCSDYDMCNQRLENSNLNLNSMGIQIHQMNFLILTFLCLTLFYF